MYSESSLEDKHVYIMITFRRAPGGWGSILKMEPLREVLPSDKLRHLSTLINCFTLVLFN